MTKEQEALKVAREFIDFLPDYISFVVTRNDEDVTETIDRSYVIDKINEALQNEQ